MTLNVQKWLSLPGLHYSSWLNSFRVWVNHQGTTAKVDPIMHFPLHYCFRVSSRKSCFWSSGKYCTIFLNLGEVVWPKDMFAVHYFKWSARQKCMPFELVHIKHTSGCQIKLMDRFVIRKLWVLQKWVTLRHLIDPLMVAVSRIIMVFVI